ncbi:glycoside hydrolase family 3 N-terminal domain-containing protein [Phaeovulum sp. W22_SRMD_FR3]|uniref:glycoside hydrolase family 3 N-terminal domain-containing protein n=1 Tax=Phaeovulum sp. W22_SRMD_FR3 TaxID=3240274 RepID=UPI003F991F2C
MHYTLQENARAILLPAFDTLTLSDATRRFLDQGGVSILLGESRAEYVAREMSASRRASETAADIQAVTEAARQRAEMMLTCVDQEMGGISRLHGLVPSFPAAEALAETTDVEIEQRAAAIATAARDLGVNAFLAPLVDVLIGPNSWLQGRTWSQDPTRVGALSAAYVRGVQRAGVAATVKHFPGFGTTTGDPALEATAVNPLDLASLEAAYPAFRAPISAGSEMVMVGPAIVQALDPERAALRSAEIIALLREGFGFTGVVMADDLDSSATMRGDPVPQVAIEALAAGCDYLLLADVGNQLDEVAAAIVAAAEAGVISAEALAASAARVRDLALRYAA